MGDLDQLALAGGTRVRERDKRRDGAMHAGVELGLVAGQGDGLADPVPHRSSGSPRGPLGEGARSPARTFATATVRGERHDGPARAGGPQPRIERVAVRAAEGVDDDVGVGGKVVEVWIGKLDFDAELGRVEVVEEGARGRQGAARGGQGLRPAAQP